MSKRTRRVTGARVKAAMTKPADVVILSATGFFPGPLVYCVHKKAWEYLAGESVADAAPAGEIALLPAPA
jgi:hypothetical protein